MGTTNEELTREAGELLPRAIELRRRIHRRPEQGLELPETKQAILEEIGDLDLEIVESRRTSGIIAKLRGARPGPKLVLRAEMDALPLQEDGDREFKSESDGTMHACGHDGHVAMLAAAARQLSAHRDQLAGEVLFMFQPGEEGYAGAKVMIDEGLLDEADS